MLRGANKITDGKALWKKCIDMFYNYKVPLLHEWLRSALRKWHQNWRQSAVISKGYSTKRIYAFFSAGDVWWRMKSDSAASAVSTFHWVTARSVVMQWRLFPIPKRPKDGQKDSDCWIPTFCIAFVPVGKVLHTGNYEGYFSESKKR